MVELVVIVCSLLHPQDCGVRHLAFESVYGSLRSCVFQGHLAAVRWQREHPDWKVQRWTCGAPQT